MCRVRRRMVRVGQIDRDRIAGGEAFLQCFIEAALGGLGLRALDWTLCPGVRHRMLFAGHDVLRERRVDHSA